MDEDELLDTKGGISKGILIGGIGVIISFIIGFIDGYSRPLSCNK